MTYTITNGNREVVITEQDGDVWATLYTNARNGIADAIITRQRWEGKTIKGAETWAARMLK